MQRFWDCVEWLRALNWYEALALSLGLFVAGWVEPGRGLWAVVRCRPLFARIRAVFGPTAGAHGRPGVKPDRRRHPHRHCPIAAQHPGQRILAILIITVRGFPPIAAWSGWSSSADCAAMLNKYAPGIAPAEIDEPVPRKCNSKPRITRMAAHPSFHSYDSFDHGSLSNLYDTASIMK